MIIFLALFVAYVCLIFVVWMLHCRLSKIEVACRVAAENLDELEDSSYAR